MTRTNGGQETWGLPQPVALRFDIAEARLLFRYSPRSQNGRHAFADHSWGQSTRNQHREGMRTTSRENPPGLLDDWAEERWGRFALRHAFAVLVRWSLPWRAIGESMAHGPFLR
jgi:hypothetical protein